MSNHAQKSILVVEGNTPEACEHAAQFGQASQSDNYVATLRSLERDLDIAIATPADLSKAPVTPIELNRFDGIVFTGSSLHAYDTDPEVTRQIDLMKRSFEAGKPIFGSCWGLQVAVVATGGSVEPNSEGRELGIARRIRVTETGDKHFLYQDKARVFDAIAIHLDHVTRLPSGANVLASNEVSHVQAMSMSVGDSSFVGVQYHPEFSFRYMSMLFLRYQDMMLSEGFVRSPQQLDALIEDFTMLDELAPMDLQWRHGIGAGLSSQQERLREISNWLERL